MTVVAMLVDAWKHTINVVVAPTWCVKCGSSLFERQVGYREQGSRYECSNPGCELHGLSVASPPVPPRSIVKPASALASTKTA